MKDGEWFMYPIDQPMPRTLKIWSGGVLRRTKVREINRYQAMAYARWHGHQGLYFSYRGANGRMIDVRVVGDIDAWRGEDAS